MYILETILSNMFFQFRLCIPVFLIVFLMISSFDFNDWHPISPFSHVIESHLHTQDLKSMISPEFYIFVFYSRTNQSWFCERGSLKVEKYMLNSLSTYPFPLSSCEHMGQLFQDHSFKRLSLLHCVTFSILSKIS